MLNIGVLISGGGSNLQAIIDDCESKKINGNIKVVISNREDAFGLERAKKHNIRSVFEKDEDEVIKILKEENIDLVVYAGPIKMQDTVKVMDDDDAKTLAKRVLEVEHTILPRCVKLFCEGKISVEGRRVRIK